MRKPLQFGLLTKFANGVECLNTPPSPVFGQKVALEFRFLAGRLMNSAAGLLKFANVTGGTRPKS